MKPVYAAIIAWALFWAVWNARIGFERGSTMSARRFHFAIAAAQVGCAAFAWWLI